MMSENHTITGRCHFTGGWSRTAVHAFVMASGLAVAGCSGGANGDSSSNGFGPQTGGSAGAAGTGAVADPAARYFVPDHVLEVALELDAADWDALRVEKRSLKDMILGKDCQSAPFASPFTWKRADVTIDGKRISAVGVRKKGFLGSLDEDRPSLKIGIDQFVQQDLFGVRDFTLNNVRQDPAVISECLGFDFFAKVGLAAPRCNFAHVSVNGVDLGVYVHLEPIKKPFLRRHFTSDAGDLYEGTLSDFRAGWLGTFDPKTDETDPTRGPLNAVADALAANEGERLDRLRKVIDLEQFLAFWATETAIDHVDGYSRNNNNFYAYRDPGTGLTTLVPWGADLLFGNGDSSAHPDDLIGHYTVGAIANTLYASADGRQLLLDALGTLLRDFWREGELIADAEAMAGLVRPYLLPARVAAFDDAQLAIAQFIENRRAALERVLNNPPTSAQPLRGPACLDSIGHLSGSFSTTWGTVGSDNPFASGTALLDVTVRGVAFQYLSGYIGAMAGPNPDSTAAEDSQLVALGMRSDGMLSVVAFGFDHSRAVPGTIDLDLEQAPGVLLQLDPNVAGSTEVVGVIVGGTLQFEQIGTQPGAPVTGRFVGDLYSTPLLDGF